MSDDDCQPQNPSENDGRGENDDEDSTNNQQKKPSKLSLSAGSISVEAESTEESLQEIAEVCNGQMETMMRYHLRGEMQVLEEDDLHSIMLGDD